MSALFICSFLGYYSFGGNSIIKREMINDLSYQQDLNDKEIPDYESKDFKNAILEDARQKAKTNSTLVYFIGWGAVFHKFGSLTHMFNVLELNSNKTIYFFVKRNFLDISIKNEIISRYKNVHIEEMDYDSLWSDRWSQINNPIFSKIWSLNNFDFYCDDYFILRNISLIFGKKISEYDFDYLFNQKIKFLYKANSINLFADGTASREFYNNNFYELNVLINNILIDGEYKNSIDKYNEFKSKIINNERIWFTKYSDVFYFLLSPVITNHKGNSNNKTKYFMPTCQMIIEMNQEGTSELSYNDNNKTFYDPYNSLNAGLMESFANLNDSSKKFIYSLMKSSNFDPSYWIGQFNGFTNYIYSGSLLEDENIITKEAQKIIYLYENFIDKSKPFKLFFKGHPRETHNIKNVLMNKIIELNSNLNPKDWLYTLDEKIPYEIYLVSEIMNPSNQYEIKLFSNFSTSVLFLYDYNKAININKFLLSNNDMKIIDEVYGKKSKIFLQDKIVVL